MAAAGHGSLQVHDDDDGEDYSVDAFSKKELARRPEVRFINTYAVLLTYVLMGLRGIGVLELLWATVVLGSFVSSLNEEDLRDITFIALVQAAGMFDAVFDNQFKHLMMWKMSVLAKVISCLGPSRLKHNEHVDTQPQRASCASRRHACWSRLKGTIRPMISKVKAFIVFLVLDLGLGFCAYGPLICAVVSYVRLGQPDYGSAYKDASEDNLKRALDLFYYLCYAQGLIFMVILLPAELLAGPSVVNVVSRKAGLSREVVLRYYVATKRKHFSNLASCAESWNFITYGAGLLDSEMPEDNASGARLLTTLIEHGVPVRRRLLRSPRVHRIQKLIGTLAWTSPSEGEMRGLAARIVQHVAPELSLAQFPGALECISSLLDTSGYYNMDGDHEATYFVAQLRLEKKRQGMQDRKQLSINSAEGTNEDLILQGLRILEHLALDERNCKVICCTDSLLSKIVAPVSSEELIQDTKTNTAWAKVTDGSLKLLSRLMTSLGDSDTGKELQRRVADNSCAVKNLEKVLALEINISNIIALQIRAIEILEQLCSGDGESTYTINSTRERSRENLVMKLLHIFLTDKWMEDYLSKTQQDGQALAENKMNAAHETARHLKEKAGESLATLCMGNQINTEYITRFTGLGDVVHYLTEMLDSNERSIRCRSSAAVILKHLCTHCITSTLDNRYLVETTLKKVLIELLHIKTEAQATSNSKLIQWQQAQGGNDIENQRGGGHNVRLPVSVQGRKQQQEERRLQVALLSLCAAIRGRWIDAPDFASVLAQLASPEQLAEKLKKLVDANRYATPSCLATVKLSCELVTALIPHDHRAKEVKMKEVIVDSLYQASKTMAGLESCMLFAGTDRDCYGLPVKPFCFDLVKEAQEVLRQKGRALALNIV